MLSDTVFKPKFGQNRCKTVLSFQAFGDKSQMEEGIKALVQKKDEYQIDLGGTDRFFYQMGEPQFPQQKTLGSTIYYVEK